MEYAVKTERSVDSRHFLSTSNVQVEKYREMEAEHNVVQTGAGDIDKSCPESNGFEVLGVGVQEEREVEVLEGPRAVHGQQHQHQQRRLRPARVLRVGAAVHVVEDQVVGQLRQQRLDQLEPDVVVDRSSVHVAAVDSG